MVAIEAIRKPNGTYEAYTDNGRESTGVDVYDWAQQAETLGAGEILLTSIDCEGTGNGFDLGLTKRIAESVDIPVIASGGGGNVGHISDVVINGKADAVCLASMLHYGALITGDDDDYSVEGNLEYLTGSKSNTLFPEITIGQVKDQLLSYDIERRPF